MDKRDKRQAVADAESRWSRLTQAFVWSALTQRELADATGSHESTVSKWLRGRTAPSLEKLERLAAAMGVRFAWLAHADGAMRGKQ